MKRRPPRLADKRLALNKRLVKIRGEIAKLKRDRAAVSRDEFVEMSTSLRQLQKNTDDLIEHTKNLATQFTRIAQIQGLSRRLLKFCGGSVDVISYSVRLSATIF